MLNSVSRLFYFDKNQKGGEPMNRLESSRILTIPNILTMLRIALVPPLAMTMLDDGASEWLAFGIFVLAAVTDGLDGYIARKYKCASTFGRVFDPIADKILVGTALVILAMRGSAPLWMAGVIIAREAVMIVLSWIVKRQSRLVSVNALGKAKMIAQSLAIPLLIIASQHTVIAEVGYGLLLVAVLLTIASAVHYSITYFRMPRHA
ncbi:MAG: CDP-diacylglycerol--glycerol-3-phosphate 3-phosphatidyltransferase [bacterium]|nr:CDP-diacylglycerol--glycerol-3-phosphate 3-phosphatidyltransferase [bacterium]